MSKEAPEVRDRMSTVIDDTTVSERGGTQVPAEIRERLNVGGGDTMRWSIQEDGTLEVEVIHTREGAFEDFEPGSTDEPTNARRLEEEFGLG